MTLHEQTFRAMNCQMSAVLESDLPNAAEALAQVPLWFQAWEDCLSRFRATSELSQLNRRPGEWVPVSPVLWAVLQAALQGAEQSNGLVLPTLLTPLEAAGYNRSFDELKLRPETDTSPQFHLVPTQNVQDSIHAIEVNPEQQSVRLSPGVALDLGGVAKGWCADTVVQRLAPLGAVLIDAGGDIAIGGLQTDAAHMLVGVANPMQPDQLIEVLALQQGGVATSGRDYRHWQFNGQLQHHIIDPRTSQPAQTDVLSATVIAPSAIRAESAAKCAFILGSVAGLTWLNAQPDLAGLLVLDNQQTLASQHWHTFISHEDDADEIHT